jgi:hypothetical protein
LSFEKRSVTHEVASAFEPAVTHSRPLNIVLDHANAIAVFSVSSTGGLSQIPGSPFPAGHGTSLLAAASGNSP